MQHCYEKIKQHVMENEPIEVRIFAQRANRNVRNNNETDVNNRFMM